MNCGPGKVSELGGAKPQQQLRKGFRNKSVPMGKKKIYIYICISVHKYIYIYIYAAHGLLTLLLPPASAHLGLASWVKARTM